LREPSSAILCGREQSHAENLVGVENSYTKCLRGEWSAALQSTGALVRAQSIHQAGSSGRTQAVHQAAWPSHFGMPSEQAGLNFTPLWGGKGTPTPIWGETVSWGGGGQVWRRSPLFGRPDYSTLGGDFGDFGVSFAVTDPLTS